MPTTTESSTTRSSIFFVVLGIFCLCFPIIVSIYQPQLMMSSDYVANFYPAGKLVLMGRFSDLYASVANTPFMDSAFNCFAHQLLPNLAPTRVSIYMYSPLTAILFSLLAGLKPQISLIVWQLASIAAYTFSIYLVSVTVNQDFKKCFWRGLLYFSIFQTLLIGQLGLIAGLLPLSLGYACSMHKRHFLAGICWSFLLLKPQFLPVAFLVSAALAINKKYRCLAGLIMGIFLLIGFGALYATPAIFGQWLNSFKISDTIFSDARYTYPSYMITSLPAVLLHFFSVDFRNIVKIPVYLLAFLVGLHALWFSCRALKLASENNKTALSSVFVIGIALLPIILPHFLFYDFSAFVLFAVLFFSQIWTGSTHWRLIALNWLYAIILAVYHILFYFPTHQFLQPSLLVFLIVLLYCRLLKILGATFQAGCNN